MTLFKNFAWNKETQALTFGLLGTAQVNGDMGVQRSLGRNDAYVNVMLRSMRVPYSRRGWTAYSAALHCFSRLQFDKQPLAEFHSLATPAKLKEIDPQDESKIEMGESRLLGPVPYRGGDLALELGLFSAKTDLAGPYLALLSKVGAVSGLGAWTNALALVQAFREGIDALRGGPGSALEIGVSNTFEDVVTGCYVLAAIPSNAVRLDEFRVDANGHLSARDTPVKEPHVVFTIGATTRRADWQTLPDIGDAYRAINSFLLSNNQVDAQKAFQAFALRARLSPDLLPDDARRIVQEVEADLKDLLQPTRTGAQSIPRTLVAPAVETAAAGAEIPVADALCIAAH